MPISKGRKSAIKKNNMIRAWSRWMNSPKRALKKGGRPTTKGNQK